MTIATLPKIRPRAKYINTKFWHFRENVELENVMIHHIAINEQNTEILIKPLTKTEFSKLKAGIMEEEKGAVVEKGNVVYQQLGGYG